MKFKSISISVAATALLMAAPPAYAANWIFVDYDVNNTVFYYDVDSIQRSGNQVTVWEKWDRSRDKTSKERERKLRQRYDCAERTFTDLDIFIYFPDGKNDSFNYKPYEQTVISIVPESIGETMFDAVCAVSAP